MLPDEDRFSIIDEDLFKIRDQVIVIKDQVDIVGVITSIDGVNLVISHDWGYCYAKVWEVTKVE